MNQAFAPEQEDLPTQIQRALTRRKSGDAAGSLAIFLAASAARPAHPGLRLEAAFDLRTLGRPAEARCQYEAVLAAHPEQVGAMLGLGLCARDLGDPASALDWMQRARAADPAHLAAALEMAAELRRLNRWEEADAAYAELLDRHPGQVAALLGLALGARRRGNRVAARMWLDRAVAADPAHPGARLELAAELRDAGETEAACAQAEALLAREPDHAAALISLGLSERAAGRSEAALAAFARAHAAHPARVDALVQMAIEHRALGQIEACERWLDQAHALAPDDVAVLVQCAEQARMAGDVVRMHAIYAEAAGAQPGALPLQLGLAEARTLLGQAPSALEDLARLEESASDPAPVRLKRLNVLRRMGDLYQALALGREACRLWPGHFNIWAERLMCEATVGDRDALPACLDAAPARTAQDRAHLARLRAHVLEGDGERETALRLLDEASALDPNSAVGAMVATRLALGQLDLARAREGAAAFLEATRVATRLRGRSPHPSQTLYGQLIDELALDQDCISRLRAGRGQTGTARVESVLREVAHNPGSTAAALELATALRACGLAGSPLPRPLQPAAGSPVTKTVLQFWDSASPPDDIAMLMRSWGALNPDHAYRRVDSAAARDFITRTYGARAGAVFARAREPAQQADLFRLGYLAALGGIYADADDRCIAPVSSVLPSDAGLVLYIEDLGSIGNNFIAAAPGQEVLVRAFGLGMSALGRGDEDSIWLSTGPGLLTRALAETLARAGPNWREALAGIAILARRDVYRAVAIHCATAYKTTSTYWASKGERRRVG